MNSSTGRSPFCAYALTLLVCAVWAAALPAQAIASDGETGGFTPPSADEHPRLILRASEVATVRAAAKAEWGKPLAERMAQSLRLMDLASITGRNQQVIKEAGFEAAGHAAMFIVTGDQAEAQAAARTIISEVIGYPMRSRISTMDRLSQLQGTVFAYDLSNPQWSASDRDRIVEWMRGEAESLLAEAEKAGEPERLTAWATAGMLDMAMLGKPGVDDKAARKRIAQAAGHIRQYLDQSIGEMGFDVRGESIRQAVMASAVLPFVRAGRLVLNGELDQHDAVRHVLSPMVYQLAPGVGVPMIGPRTAGLDRTGLFAMGFDLTPSERRPAAAWAFEQVGGRRYLGVVRPHQGLYMFGHALLRTEAAAPADAELWPRTVVSRRGGVVVARTGWAGADDVMTLVQNGSLRILGMGSRWAGYALPHADAYSHDVAAGRMDNTYMVGGAWPGTDRRAPRAYRVTAERSLEDVSEDAEQRCTLASWTVRGQVERLREKIKFGGDRRKNIPDREIEIPAGGAVSGRRLVAVDYSGVSGAAAVIVTVDELTGADDAPRAWVLHLDREATHEVGERGFTVTHGDATLHAAVVSPGELTIRTTYTPMAHFVTIYTTSPKLEVVMTLQRGKAPEVDGGKGGLVDGVTVGGRRFVMRDGALHVESSKSQAAAR